MYIAKVGVLSARIARLVFGVDLPKETRNISIIMPGVEDKEALKKCSEFLKASNQQYGGVVGNTYYLLCTMFKQGVGFESLVFTLEQSKDPELPNSLVLSQFEAYSSDYNTINWVNIHKFVTQKISYYAKKLD